MRSDLKRVFHRCAIALAALFILPCALVKGDDPVKSPKPHDNEPRLEAPDDFSNAPSYKVLLVPSSDSVVLKIDGKTTSVHLLGIEGSDKSGALSLRNLLKDQSVYIKYDPDERKDENNHAYARIFMAPQGLLINQDLIDDGARAFADKANAGKAVAEADGRHAVAAKGGAEVGKPKRKRRRAVAAGLKPTVPEPVLGQAFAPPAANMLMGNALVGGNNFNPGFGGLGGGGFGGNNFNLGFGGFNGLAGMGGGGPVYISPGYNANTGVYYGNNGYYGGYSGLGYTQTTITSTPPNPNAGNAFANQINQAQGGGNMGNRIIGALGSGTFTPATIQPSMGAGGFYNPSMGAGGFYNPSMGAGGFYNPSMGAGGFYNPSMGAGGFYNPSMGAGGFYNPSMGGGGFHNPSGGASGLRH